ncbi:MAG: hypothetical protein IJ232_03995 [Lachnospiraceae bacterium]|nr:hypothetical protein [Lachnospiraceae bacterium]
MEDMYNICFYGGLTLAIIFLLVSIVLFIVFKIPKVIGDLTGRNARKEIAEKRSKKGRTDTSSRLSKQEQKKYYNQNTGKITIRDSITNEEETAQITSDVQAPERETDILRPGDEYEAYNTQGSLKDKKKNASKGEEETTVLGNSSDEEETTILESSNTYNNAADEFDPDGETDVLRADDSGVFESESNDFDPDGETDVLRSDDNREFDADGETDVLRAPDINDSDEATTVLAGGEDEDETTVLSADNIKDTNEDKKYIYSVVIVHTEESL